MDILKITSDMMQDLLDTMVEVGNKFETGRVCNSREALGKRAEVSVSISSGATGEVVVVVGKGMQSFPARSLDGKMEFNRGALVKIVEIGPNGVLVEPYVSPSEV